MKRIITSICLLLLVAAASFAQTEKRIYTSSEKIAIENARIKADSTLRAKSKQDAKALKELQKRIEAQQDSIAYDNAVKALDSLDFVLEADKIIFKYGDMAYVQSNTNFISLSDDKAVVQVAPFNGGGPNGVGGITLDGRQHQDGNRQKRYNHLFHEYSGSGYLCHCDHYLTERFEQCHGSERAHKYVYPHRQNEQHHRNLRAVQPAVAQNICCGIAQQDT